MLKNKQRILAFLSVIICVCLLLAGCEVVIDSPVSDHSAASAEQSAVSQRESSASSGTSGLSGGYTTDTVPDFSDSAYVAVNDNVPYFTPSDYTTTSFESYSELDALGRCGVAFACVAQDTMPTEKRGSIGSVKPSGWKTAKYDIVDGGYLYNRCHLIGYQLTAENANKSNLITGTRYLNVDGMLPFENMVADYVKETNNHVLYRVTPIFDGNNLVARGVLMEAYSVEDDGDGICFNVYAYNNQPGIIIDYATGESRLDENYGTTAEENYYILNTNNHKFHLPTCASVTSMKDANKQEYHGTREELIAKGYQPCSRCNP